MIEIEYTWIDNGRWHRTSLTAKEYAVIMNSGMIDGKQIAAVRVWECESELTEGTELHSYEDHLIYDFNRARAGQPAWRSEI